MPRPQFLPKLALLLGTIVTTTALATTASPVLAKAERIYVTYGLLERSVQLEALERYAATGQLDDDLYVYTSYVSEEQRQQLRKILQAKADISPVAISQFLYSPQGELLLKRLGQVIQPEARTDGAVAIRSALILAAADPVEGLSPLNIMRKFPTRGIRVDLQKTLQVAGEIEKVFSENQRYVNQVVATADREAAAAPVPRAPINLANPGRIPFTTTTVQLTDNARIQATGVTQARSFPVDVYLPSITSSAPAIVISHGVGSDRITFRTLAKHLASHGFAVFVPEHPGSSGKQIDALIRGLASEVAEPTEFLDRPLDIKYLLDYFSRLSSTDSRYKNINFQKVGVLGQSFGGYTALALGGAKLDFENLKSICTEDALLNTFNVSLALQCRATQLFNQNYPLADSRIAAIVSINPFASAVFGSRSLDKIQVPTLIISSGSDTIAPAVPEQIVPFTQLKMRDRYLVMMPQGSHFSFLEDAGGPGPINIPEGVVGPNPAQARRYMNALGLAFFRTHLTPQVGFRSFLTPGYVKSISDDSQPIGLVTSFDLKSDIKLPTRGVTPTATPTPNPTPATSPVPLAK
jgi:predicted dienelactone hydrolase